MNIVLPHRVDGQAPTTLQGVRGITIIGANGSGKTRFALQMMQDQGEQAFRLNVQRALYPSDPTAPNASSIDKLFLRINNAATQVKSTANTEFDRLSYILMHEEFMDMMNYKAHLLMQEKPDWPKTKLDMLVRLWQEVFPKNKILREGGKLMFTTEGQNDKYTMLRLSHGEKAVLYYIAGVLYAQKGATIFIDDPETFMHHSIMQTLWNVIEQLRTDCTFVYNTHDIDFASSRIDNRIVWVKSFDPAQQAWEYEVLQPGDELNDGIYMDILGSRKPVLFIEGDSTHSIDSRLYPLVFTDFTIKPVGSCNKVIEAVRSFNDLRSFHHLDSHGIVDRDRRSDKEVQYLRNKKILVPNVAEIENILMLEGVVRAVARHCHKNEDDVAIKVKRAVVAQFDRQLRQQALMHVRHRVKMEVEKRIDQRFTNISALEDHMVDLVNEINPRGLYERTCRDFHRYVETNDYNQVLRVFNQKTMLSESNVASLCGLRSKDEYINTILKILRADGPDAKKIRETIRHCFGIDDTTTDTAKSTDTAK